MTAAGSNLVQKPSTSQAKSPEDHAPAEAARSTGERLKKSASAEGFAAQEALLAPGSGVLKPPQVETALRYNRKLSARPDFVSAVQSELGVGSSGTWDAPTVQGVAAYQGQRSLAVDGMVGTQTKAALKKDGVGAGGAGGASNAKGPEAATPREATPEAATTSSQPASGPLATDTTGATEEARDASTAGPAAEAKAKAHEGAAEPGAGAQAVAEQPVAHALTSPPTSFGAGTTLAIGPLVAWSEAGAAEVEAKLGTLATMDPAAAEATALVASMMAAGGPLEASCKALRDRAVKLVNDASLLKRPEAQPTLPTRAELQALSAALRRIGKAGGALDGATKVGLDAILAIQQGASVLAARATWAEKPREASGKEEIDAQKGKKDDALNAIFRDSGFATRVTSHTNSEGVDKIHDWCGMFVGASLFRGGGLDEELRAGMLHTSNVLDYFQYMQVANAGRVPRSIWADGEWHEMKEYHATRGSVRQWQSRAAVTSVMEGGGPLDVRPGDVVLIDHSGKGKEPQHITMVESYDPATHQLVTIEGNTGGIRAGDDGKVTEAGEGYYKTNATGRDGSGLHTRDMTNMSDKSRQTHAEAHAANMEKYKGSPKGAYRGTKGMTVFGIGRPSAVDFEEHQYATKAVPAELKRTSPAEMEQKAKTKVGVHDAK